MKKSALIVVDYQYDFADPKGNLYVPGGENLKEKIIEKIYEYRDKEGLVVFSGDFHPEKHVSFDKWGEHCVVGTNGAEFYIDYKLANLIIQKGTEKNFDSYSAFYIDQTNKVESSLYNFLKQNNVEELEICGLALDVCVKATYDDAIKLGFNTKVNLELSKQIEKEFIWKD